MAEWSESTGRGRSKESDSRRGFLNDVKPVQELDFLERAEGRIVRFFLRCSVRQDPEMILSPHAAFRTPVGKVEDDSLGIAVEPLNGRHRRTGFDFDHGRVRLRLFHDFVAVGETRRRRDLVFDPRSLGAESRMRRQMKRFMASWVDGPLTALVESARSMTESGAEVDASG